MNCIANEKKFITISELNDMGMSYYKISQLVKEGILSKVNRTTYENLQYSGDENDFYRRLDEAMDLAARSLKIKRGVLTRLLTEGLYPYTKRYMGTYDRHYSSIGPVGINEACLNAHWLKRDLWNPTAQKSIFESDASLT